MTLVWTKLKQKSIVCKARKDAQASKLLEDDLQVDDISSKLLYFEVDGVATF